MGIKSLTDDMYHMHFPARIHAQLLTVVTMAACFLAVYPAWIQSEAGSSPCVGGMCFYIVLS